uniref:Uncharacterized protein n=1 Tax=Eptatretus burgeri TaxID=7764 RepID=A0A8C4QAQ0_EPTBU
TPVTRKAAAQQLGEVQRLHPHELHNLLAKVLTYLHSQSWDTRIAAGQAIEAIVKHVCQWKPPPNLSVTPASERDYEDHLRFSRFDIFQLLQRGTSLVGSTGSEFDVSEDKGEYLDPRERVARQRRALQKKLGLDVGGALGITTEDLFDDEDLATTCSPSQGHGRLGKSLQPVPSLGMVEQAKKMVA